MGKVLWRKSRQKILLFCHKIWLNPMALHTFERSRSTLFDLANDVKELERYEKHDPYDKARDITRQAHVDIPNFDGRIDPQVFSVC